MKYFILHSPGQAAEIARWTRGNSAACYDFPTGEWVSDPLLAAEIILDDDWQPIDRADLPDELAQSIRQPKSQKKATRSSRWRPWLRDGLHVRS